jgi:hypothetical protein
MITMDSPLPDHAAEAADSQPATDGPMGLAAVPCSLTVDQMADALGLYACDFWAKHPRDCDVCSDAKEGEMIWVMMAGAYPGSTQEAEYYACSSCVAIKHAAAFSSENTDYPEHNSGE